MKYAIVSLTLAAVIGMVGCQSSPEPVRAATPANTAPVRQDPVNVPVKDTFVASGPITVENQLDLAAQRDGIVSEVLVDAGSPVRKGQMLARLDDRQLTADRDAAKNQADSIEADLKNWEATVKMAETDLSRSEKMFAANLITQSQVDHDRFKLTATKYEFDREQKNFQRSKDVVRSLELELEKTRITAPFDGVVARRYVHAGQRVANGDRLLWVTATAPMRVRFTVPEKYAGAVKRGDLVEVIGTELPDERHSAKILLVSPVIDPASGTIDVTAELTGQTGALRPGMMANIKLDKLDSVR